MLQVVQQPLLVTGPSNLVEGWVSSTRLTVTKSLSWTKVSVFGPSSTWAVSPIYNCESSLFYRAMAGHELLFHRFLFLSHLLIPRLDWTQFNVLELLFIGVRYFLLFLLTVLNLFLLWRMYQMLLLFTWFMVLFLLLLQLLFLHWGLLFLMIILDNHHYWFFDILLRLLFHHWSCKLRFLFHHDYLILHLLLLRLFVNFRIDIYRRPLE